MKNAAHSFNAWNLLLGRPVYENAGQQDPGCKGPAVISRALQMAPGRHPCDAIPADAGAKKPLPGFAARACLPEACLPARACFACLHGK